MPLLSYMVWQPGVWKRREAKCDVWRPASMTRRGCLKGHRQYQKRKKDGIQSSSKSVITGYKKQYSVLWLLMWYHGEGDVAALDRSPLQDREIVHRRDEMAGGF
ncbi:hypothetical protein FVEG_11545 [Fusarium verticillioides 7600]|uniref:Uncharacterized protein n=1 Tax=Gibberella moniliformis (strain M3125 / FGSC 7600) TaxID=334819 RepID=W7N983_GIBM7|nr:hypothetical protein FVEG_11545 [Fusarium verticillioides 7600]EWG53012.1 hypothetical protein FVEG_11545 [Fusarium verticillioides 7600]